MALKVICLGMCVDVDVDAVRLTGLQAHGEQDEFTGRLAALRRHSYTRGERTPTES